MKDFFISYTGVDQAWAEWIAKQLENAGYSTIIQAWDFLPGANFVKEMQRATLESKRTIAVLSKSYGKSGFAESEWAAAFAGDSQTEKRKVIPIRVESFQPNGLLSPIVYIDLVGVDETEAQNRLIQNIQSILEGKRLKPAFAPFPGIKNKIVSDLLPEDQKRDNSLISISSQPKHHAFNAKLLELLEQQSIPVQRAQSAFLKCLPSGWPDEKRMVLNYHDVVNRLPLVPQGGDNFDATTQFLGFLSQDIQLPNQTRNTIKTWATENMPGFSAWLNSLSSTTVSESACSTLMIYLQRCDSGQSQKHSIRYDLDAWFAPYPQIVEITKENSPQKTSITWHQAQQIELSEMPSVLTRYLREIQSEHSPKHLTLEFFLPLDLLNYAVEHCGLDDDSGLDLALGHQYQVVLRCAERIEPSYRLRPIWEKRWDKLQQGLSKTAFGCLASGDEKKPRSLYGEISTSPHLVGIMLSQVPEKIGKGSVFGVILQAGLPLAIWVRSLLTKLDCTYEMNELLQCNLGELPEVVKDTRLISLQSSVEEDENIGDHLSLLWDNPYCVPQLSILEMS